MKNIPTFLIEEKKCDSLPLVTLNNINIDDEIPLIVWKNNSSGAEVEGGLLSIDNLLLIGKCSANVFKVNESAILEYKRLQENRFDTIYIGHVDCSSLTNPC